MSKILLLLVWLLGMTEVINSVHTHTVYTCVTCHRHRHHRQRFRACELLSLKADLQQINDTMWELETNFRSSYNVDVDSGYTFLRESLPQIQSSSFVDLLNDTYHLIQEMHLRSKLMLDGHSGPVRFFRSKIHTISTQTKSATCQIRDILDYGLVGADADPKFKPCPVWNTDLDNDSVTYFLVRFIVEQTLTLEYIIARINRNLEE